MGNSSKVWIFLASQSERSLPGEVVYFVSISSAYFLWLGAKSEALLIPTGGLSDQTFASRCRTKRDDSSHRVSSTHL